MIGVVESNFLRLRLNEAAENSSVTTLVTNDPCVVEDVKQNNAYTDSLLGRERLGESVADSSNCYSHKD